ncbi:MAG: anthranilate phosphoribosyltransferase [Candidatus Pacebacteria bacterium]|nr:anthranilate phosphoribosyltransferase [Candidatus Paceibacterota bacterium]
MTEQPLIPNVIKKLLQRRDLDRAEMSAALESIIAGDSNEAQIGGFLVGLAVKGESIEEVIGAVQTLRRHALKLNLKTVPELDTAGTGGDGMGSFNLSTTAAIIAAALGVRVAKHYNRAQSSICGSADLMEALGLPMVHPPQLTELMLDRHGIGFLFAPTFHGATKAVAQVRRDLKVRTLFNILGPMTNPCGVKSQLIGVYDHERAKLMARAMVQLGCERALLVTAESGLDEISPIGKTQIVEIAAGAIKNYTVTPADFGAAEMPLESIQGGTAADNAAILRRILSGRPHPARTAVSLNTAAALYAAGRVTDLKQGYGESEAIIDSGRALVFLDTVLAEVGGFASHG